MCSPSIVQHEHGLGAYKKYRIRIRPAESESASSQGLQVIHSEVKVWGHSGGVVCKVRDLDQQHQYHLRNHA